MTHRLYVGFVTVITINYHFFFIIFFFISIYIPSALSLTRPSMLITKL